MRAQADAELALAQAREKKARVDQEEAREDAKTQEAINAARGAIK
jgi:hypothetical protein